MEIYDENLKLVTFNMDFIKGLDWNNITHRIKLTVTSPPYFNARDYGGETLFEDADDWVRWCVRGILKISEFTREDGVIWWNTGSGYQDHHKMTEIYKMVLALETQGIYLIDEIPWIKKSAPPKRLRNRPYPAWEHNFVFAKNPDKVTFYRDHVRQPYAKATLERMKYKLGKLSPDMAGEYGEENNESVKPHPGGATPPNYLHLPQDTSRRPHPAPMLPELANWAIRAYSEEEDWILDPMMGVGTTMIEAAKLNRMFIGFELFPEYMAIAQLSLDRYKRGDDPYRGLKKEWESLQ